MTKHTLEEPLITHCPPQSMEQHPQADEDAAKKLMTDVPSPKSATYKSYYDWFFQRPEPEPERRTINLSQATRASRAARNQLLSVSQTHLPEMSDEEEEGAGPSGLHFKPLLRRDSLEDEDGEGQSPVPFRRRCQSWNSRMEPETEIDLGLGGEVEDEQPSRESSEAPEQTDENQLTITSNGSKIVVGTVLLERNGLMRAPEPEERHVDIPSGLPCPDRLLHHPQTIACRPISESSSLAQLSLASSMATDPNKPMCKICHLNGRDGDPLISPCKCAGTMQYIHCGCLMRWLEISSKKSKKPLSCELCQYQYHWHKTFKASLLFCSYILANPFTNAGPTLAIPTLLDSR